MREIRYRGKDIKTGEWAYGAMIDGTVNTVIFDKIYYTEHGGLGISKDNCWWVNPKTVGQYLGRKDKSGNDIYEGDILKCLLANDEEIYLLVQFGEFEGGYGYYTKQLNGIGAGTCEYLDKKEIEFMGMAVAGNLYDNPELLEVGHV